MKNLNIDVHLRRTTLVAIEKTNREPTVAAAELRRCVEALVNQLLEHHYVTPKGTLDLNIGALRDQSVVPEIVANQMHTIRILGNLALHPKAGEPALQSGDIYPSVTALVAILEWLNSRG